MKCPACNQSLVEYNAGPFQVDICRDGCAGIWFDTEELEQCDQRNKPFPKELLRVRKNADTVVDRSKKRACPRCADSILTRISLDPERRFEIDHCNCCGGHWLDIGELEHLRDLKEEAQVLEQRLARYQEKINRELQTEQGAQRVGALVRLLFK